MIKIKEMIFNELKRQKISPNSLASSIPEHSSAIRAWLYGSRAGSSTKVLQAIMDKLELVLVSEEIANRGRGPFASANSVKIDEQLAKEVSSSGEEQ